MVGVLAEKGQSSMGQDQDDVVYVPLTTAQERLLGITYVQSISIQVSSPEKIEEVQNNLTNSPIPKGRGFCFTGNSLFFHRKNMVLHFLHKGCCPTL